jgi:hypothetical protein
MRASQNSRVGACPDSPCLKYGSQRATAWWRFVSSWLQTCAPQPGGACPAAVGVHAPTTPGLSKRWQKPFAASLTLSS